MDTGHARPVEIHSVERGDGGVTDPTGASQVTEVEMIVVKRASDHPLLRATLTVLRLGRSTLLVS
jgi:hypothetical protein